MELINLTPHKIVIEAKDGRVTVEPSGQVARVETASAKIGRVNGIDVYMTTKGDVAGLPGQDSCPICGHKISPADEFEWQTHCSGCTNDTPEPKGYIVSGMVLEMLKGDRPDVFAPGELIRDKAGRPVACKGLRGK